MSNKQILIALVLGITVHIAASFIYDKYFAEKANS